MTQTEAGVGRKMKHTHTLNGVKLSIKCDNHGANSYFVLDDNGYTVPDTIIPYAAKAIVTRNAKEVKL